MSVPYTNSEASEARQWSNRYGPPNAWTASLGTAARMIGRLLDERERLMAKQTVAAPGDDYIREWCEEFQRWKAVAEEKQDLRDHFAAAALTGLLAQGDNGSFSEESYVRSAYGWADLMLRCRAAADCPLPDNAPNHDAAPAARASVESVAPQPTTRGDSDRTDKAAPRPSEGTGDTPATHATRGEGGEQRECTEPVAWGVAGSKGLLYATSISRMDAVDMQSEYACDTAVVPLYRQPPCQDFSQKNLTLTDAEREALNKMRVHLYEISRDNAFIDEVCDDAKAACAAVMAFLERHK